MARAAASSMPKSMQLITNLIRPCSLVTTHPKVQMNWGCSSPFRNLKDLIPEPGSEDGLLWGPISSMTPQCDHSKDAFCSNGTYCWYKAVLCTMHALPRIRWLSGWRMCTYEALIFSIMRNFFSFKSSLWLCSCIFELYILLHVHPQKQCWRYS